MSSLAYKLQSQIVTFCLNKTLTLWRKNYMLFNWFNLLELLFLLCWLYTILVLEYTWIYRQGKLSLSIYIANMDLNYWSVLSSSRRSGDEVKGVDGGYHYFSQLQISLIRLHEIWCNIQLIIYRLLDYYLKHLMLCHV